MSYGTAALAMVGRDREARAQSKEGTQAQAAAPAGVLHVGGCAHIWQA